MRVYLGAHNIISPLGFSSAENFKAVSEGNTALRKHKFDFSETPFCCAKIVDIQLDQEFAIVANKEKYTRLEKMCLLSIKNVIEQTGINLQDKNSLLILATTKGNIDVLENAYKNISSKRAYLPEFAKTIGDFFKCVNSPLVVSNACISGLLATIIAARFIENKNYKNVIICGGDIISEFTLSGFKSFNALSPELCKPFDAKRNGINLGEAVASIALSSEKISSVVLSAGASANDANHISGPSRNGDGLYQAISLAIENAGKKQVDLISAHGTATEYNDEMESTAFFRSGLSASPTNSLKGYYGHTLGAAGVLESILSIQSLAENVLLKSFGFDEPGTNSTLNIIKETRQHEILSCLKTASGFGGCNAAAVFEKI
jgi:3-oxoacyl-[acyl-carrier-protein] synthase-1